VTSSSETVNYNSDAYGQAVVQGTQSFTYDALGRMVGDTGTGGSFSLSYEGLSHQVIADGAWKYTYDPYGNLAAIRPAGGTIAQGVLAYTDLHTDLVGTFAPAGAALAGSAAYSPLGAVTAGSGLAGNLGYQSGFTDPANAEVDMGARWYAPATGDFTTRDSASVDPVPDSAAANPFAYAGDDPMTNTDPTGHMLGDPGGNGGPHTPGNTPPPAPHPPPPPPAGCPWWDVACHAVHVYYQYVAPFVHHVVHVVVVTMSMGLRDVSGLLARGLALAGHLTRDGLTAIADAARVGGHVISSGWHAAVAAGAAAEHTVTRWAVTDYHQVTHAVNTAYHAVAHAASAVATFVKNHAATIASMVVSTAVFFGCDAALGVATAGVGAIAGAAACGALSGAVGNAVSYGITAAQTGRFSWTGLAGSAATGAVAGAAGMLVGGLAASGLSAIGDAATSLLADGAQSISSDAAANAAAAGADAATATTDAAASATADATSTAGDSATLANAPEDTGLGTRAPASCGGASFTAGTKVLLATGAAVPIASLHRGQKVLATNTHTRKTRAEPVAAVLVHHDTNRYNLTIRAGHRTAVIHTTRTHLFWNPSLNKWFKAAALKYGTHLTTPGGTATALGGRNAHAPTGWMWDLTIPRDHDFYIATGTAAVLVHNCSVGQIPYNSDELSSAAYNARAESGVSPGRNVAAAKLPGWNDPKRGDIVIGFSRDLGPHAEENILQQVAARGRDPQEITGLYTERQPCSDCEGLLNENLGPDTPISWSVPWGDDPLLKAASNQLLRDMIMRAGGY
jgi:RHS repeat-associated protein